LGVGHGSTTGATAASLGSLNASHASPSAFAHAAPNSVVGQLAAYASALNNGNINAAALALAAAANHSLTAQTVMAVNTNLTAANVLSVSVTPAQAATIAAMANALQ
jgi:hypothetical protein